MGKRMTSNLRKRPIALLLVAVLMLAVACDIGVTDPDDQFMIRRPIDSLFGGAASFVASATGTNTLAFEWGPLENADSYSIVFKETQSADSMNTLIGDPTRDPTLVFTITDPQVEEVQIDPNNPDADALKVRVVPYTITSAQMDAALAEIGVEPGGSINTLYAVVAHRGSADIRSVELQRLILRRQ